MLPFAYDLRNLQVRRLRTWSTLLSVGLVVGVFCYLMCFADGLRRALLRTGDPHNLIVLAEGATAEANSSISHDEAARLAAVPRVARGPDGRLLVSPQVILQTNVMRRGAGEGGYVSVVVRGVYAGVALQVHRQVELAAGRWFRAGADELVVGLKAAERFAVDLGASMDCGERTFKVVGVFHAAGSAHESELWGHLSNVAAAFRRTRYSSVVVRLAASDAAAVGAARERIASAGIGLRPVPEPEYQAERARGAGVIRALATALALLMGAGAVFAALNTMHASVAARIREFAVLRAIGFSRRSVTLAVLLESLALAIAGGLLGCAACAVFLHAGHTTRDLVAGSTFSSIAFDVTLTPGSLGLSLGVAAAIGLLGGLWPARAATRPPVVVALRGL